MKTTIIGIGNIGFQFSTLKLPFVTTHYQAYQENPHTSLVAVADSDEKKLTAFKQITRVQTYADYRAMLKDCQPEIVSICTPDISHCPILRTVAKTPSVKGIWCEKPLATHLADAKTMVALCQKRNVTLLVNFIRRYDTLYQEIQQKRVKLLGDIQTIHSYYSGGILTNGSHLLDLLLFLLGECQEVRGIATPDGIIGQLRFGKIWTSIHPVTSYSLFEVNLLGTKARLAVTNKPFAQQEYRYTTPESFSYFPLPVMIHQEKKPLPTSKPIYMETALKDLVQSIKKNRDPLSSGKSALQSLEIIHALLYSAKHNGIPCLLPFNKKSYTLPKAQGEFITI